MRRMRGSTARDLRRRLVSGLLTLAALLASFSAFRADAQDAWDYSPYRIRVWLALSPSAELNAASQVEILETLKWQSHVCGGATWQLEASAAPAALYPSMLAALDSLTAVQIAQVEDAWSADKIMLVAVREEDGAFRITCREVDSRTRTLGVPLHAVGWQRARLARDISDLVAEAFSPLVRVETSRGKKATVRVRANGLVHGDGCVSRVSMGDVLQPVIRRNGRNGEPKVGGIQVVDWTYLLVREPQEYTLDCDVYSFSRNPLVGRSSATVERMALRVRPHGTQTELRLVTRGDVPLPMEGYEIFAKKPVAEETGEQQNLSERLGWTDWKGTIRVERIDLPMRLLYVKHGGHLLARLPLVPGLTPTAEAILPGDDKRLETEAFVKGMESTVMDLVARRAILSARIRRRLQEGKQDEARKLMDEMKALQTKEDLEMLLTERQQAGLNSADPWQQQRIDKLLSGTRMLLHKYLSPDQLVALQREVDSGQAAPAAPTTSPTTPAAPTAPETPAKSAPPAESTSSAPAPDAAPPAAEPPSSAPPKN